MSKVVDITDYLCPCTELEEKILDLIITGYPEMKVATSIGVLEMVKVSLMKMLED